MDGTTENVIVCLYVCARARERDTHTHREREREREREINSE